MTLKEIYDRLIEEDSVQGYDPIDKKRWQEIKNHPLIKILPHDHKEFLRYTDGMEVFNGYFRIFGINRPNPYNIISWNEEEQWKFSWGKVLDNYLIFGETAFGDSYAYKLDELLQNSKKATVYCLSGIEMIDEGFSFSSFLLFLENDFLRNAIKPYDTIIVESFAKFGSIPINEHLLHVPSLLLGAPDSMECIEKSNAISAMIINGDVFRQMNETSEQDILLNIDYYIDELERPRIKLNWEKSSLI